MKEYRKAGELFAYLRQELGFGELTMSARDRTSAVLFDWEFNAGGKRWRQQQTVSLDELASLHAIEEFAKRLASEWKHNYQVGK